MNRYQLAKLVEYAGKLDTRKRLQKTVYFLQAAGCPLDVEYLLHYYGPYSREVAQLTDEMVNADLLKEEVTEYSNGTQTYSYSLTDRTKEQLKNIESHPSDNISMYESLAKRLLKEADLQDLEIGATVTYFYNQTNDWEMAEKAAAKFKNKSRDSDIKIMRSATEFAREILESVRVE